MTDRYHSLTVALEKDVRDEDAGALIAAIEQLRGVAAVDGNIADPSSYTHEIRATTRFGKLFAGLAGAIVRGGIEGATRALEDVKVRSDQ